MLKNISNWLVMLGLTMSLVAFVGCAPEDISAPEENLDASGSPAGSAGMTEETEGGGAAAGAAEAPAGAAEAPAGAAEAPAGAAEAPAGDGN